MLWVFPTDILGALSALVNYTGCNNSTRPNKADWDCATTEPGELLSSIVYMNGTNDKLTPIRPSAICSVTPWLCRSLHICRVSCCNLCHAVVSWPATLLLHQSGDCQPHWAALFSKTIETQIASVWVWRAFISTNIPSSSPALKRAYAPAAAVGPRCCDTLLPMYVFWGMMSVIPLSMKQHNTLMFRIRKLH